MIKKLMQIIYPSKCIFCDKDLEFNKQIDICSECYKKLTFADNSKSEKSYVDEVYSAVEYKGEVKKAIKRFKYQNKAYLFRTFARLILNNIEKNNIKADIIVSIPLHMDREVERGYNQSELIAKELSKNMKIKYSNKILKREKTTAHLAKCNKKERKHMIEGVFKVIAPDIIKDKVVIVVDDVYTTGATINECGKVLKLGGAKKVIAITVAKVVI